MVRGRIGGGGGPFNLGEMTVTRCTRAGRAGWSGMRRCAAAAMAARAVLAARVDAVMQDAGAA
jgi:alpha-D-ribose 1-methylphosphonate 5-triphosphate synthase subunit PhnG